MAIVIAGAEGAWRAFRVVPPGTAASRLDGLVLLVVGLSAAAGLGLLVGGARPAELLHFVYAVLTFGALPIATSISTTWTPRRRGLATLTAALIALVLVLRLFATG